MSGKHLAKGLVEDINGVSCSLENEVIEKIFRNEGKCWISPQTNSCTKVFNRRFNKAQGSLRACYRFLFTRSISRTPTSYAQCMSERWRACALGQSERPVPPVPISTPEWLSCLGGQMRLLTQICVHHERTTHKVVFHRLYFLSHYSVFGQRVFLSLVTNTTLYNWCITLNLSINTNSMTI